MKHLLLLVVLCACTEDVPTLQEHAQSIERYYTVKLDAATRRLQHALEVSGKVQKDLPGSDEALRALIDARDKLVEARKIKDNVEKARQTDKVADLERLVEHEEHQYAEAIEFINENLSEVESFEANALRNGWTTAGSAAAIPEGAIP